VGVSASMHVVADGWVEPPQKTNLDKTGQGVKIAGRAV
jgi:hypothetical protein